MNHLIEENLNNEELSVDFLAEKLCISRSGLFVKIKGLANTTPNEMIQIIRLKKRLPSCWKTSTASMR